MLRPPRGPRADSGPVRLGPPCPGRGVRSRPSERPGVRPSACCPLGNRTPRCGDRARLARGAGGAGGRQGRRRAGHHPLRTVDQCPPRPGPRTTGGRDRPGIGPCPGRLVGADRAAGHPRRTAPADPCAAARRRHHHLHRRRPGVAPRPPPPAGCSRRPELGRGARRRDRITAGAADLRAAGGHPAGGPGGASGGARPGGQRAAPPGCRPAAVRRPGRGAGASPLAALGRCRGRGRRRRPGRLLRPARDGLRGAGRGLRRRCGVRRRRRHRHRAARPAPLPQPAGRRRAQPAHRRACPGQLRHVGHRPGPGPVRLGRHRRDHRPGGRGRAGRALGGRGGLQTAG